MMGIKEDEQEYREGYEYVEEGLKEKIMDVGIKQTLKLSKETAKELKASANSGTIHWVRGALLALTDFLERHNEKV